MLCLIGSLVGGSYDISGQVDSLQPGWSSYDVFGSSYDVFGSSYVYVSSYDVYASSCDVYGSSYDVSGSSYDVCKSSYVYGTAMVFWALLCCL